MRILVICAALATMAGCAGKQKITVITTPPGAEVSLTTFGVTKARVGAAGVSVSADAERFESQPLLLGTSPLDYEFELKDSQGAVPAAACASPEIRC